MKNKDNKKVHTVDVLEVNGLFTKKNKITLTPRFNSVILYETVLDDVLLDASSAHPSRLSHHDVERLTGIPVPTFD